MQRLKDAVYGALVGDALGVPFEFLPRGSFLASDMVGHGTHSQPPGTWSDDSSMILATCSSIKEKGRVDYSDIMNRFYRWYSHGEYTAGGSVFDIGVTTASALKKYELGIDPLLCGANSVGANGNGSLMRIIPLAFLDVPNETIRNVSKLTHAHEISLRACEIYVHIAKQILDGKRLAYIISDLTYERPFDRLKLLPVLDREEIMSTGYVVHTLEAALWCLSHTESYRECVLEAVNLGDDTDTTAAVAGALAGLVYGYENIPTEWIEKLKNKSLIDKCLF